MLYLLQREKKIIMRYKLVLTNMSASNRVSLHEPEKVKNSKIIDVINVQHVKDQSEGCWQQESKVMSARPAANREHPEAIVYYLMLVLRMSGIMFG